MTNLQKIGRPRSEAVLVGHCVGVEGDEKPCGRPLASGRHFKAMGVWQNVGHMRCKACDKRQKTKDRRDEGVATSPAVLPKVRIPAYGLADLSWQEGAACAGQDSGPFTTDLNGNKIPAETEAAAWRFCARCPIKARCGAEADANEELGLWAGTFRILKPRVRAGEDSRYKKYDVLAGEGPYKPQPARSAA